MKHRSQHDMRTPARAVWREIDGIALASELRGLAEVPLSELSLVDMVRTVHVFWTRRCQFKGARSANTILLAHKSCPDRGAGGIEHSRGAFLCFGELKSVSFQVLLGYASASLRSTVNPDGRTMNVEGIWTSRWLSSSCGNVR